VGSLHEKNRSLWVGTAAESDYPPLPGDLTVDVAVIGGGIAGLTTALLLKRQGARVALIEAGRIEPLIIVGIYNTGEARIDEYTPTGDKRLGGGHADVYGRMIIEELKPLIDRTYRTKPDAADTGLGGSSLGGLVSLHLGFTHPAVFSKIAAHSPSVWWGRQAILKTIRGARSKPPIRLWVDMGTAEGRKGLDDARLLKAALVGLGFTPGVDLRYAEYEGATHSEQAWSERVGPMLEWLFPATSGGWPLT